MSKNSVVVSIEFRFSKHLETGYIYTDSVFGADFWQRYLSVFDEVNVVARVQLVKEIDPTWTRVDNDKIKFHELPYYVGPKQMLAQLPRLNRCLNKIADLNACFILRVPSIIATLLYRKLASRNKAFSLEIVGDPGTVFTAETIKNKLAFLYRLIFVRELKRQAQKCGACSYVTKSSLQGIYPTRKNIFNTHYSSIEIPDYFFSQPTTTPRSYNKQRILFVGSLSQKYKGLHVLLESIKGLIESEYNPSLVVAGDGLFRSEYENLAEQLLPGGVVKFVGYKSTRQQMHDLYSNADLLVLPSLTEGLPRVVIEAMATGLPVIGSNIGGVPELLDDDALVPPGDSKALLKKLEAFFSDQELMREQAKKNRQNAEEYRNALLQERRVSFYETVSAIG